MKTVTRMGIVLGLVAGGALSIAGGGVSAGGSITCAGELTGPLPTVVVPDGASCVLLNADVSGNVSAGEGTQLFIISSYVSGNVSSVNGSFAALLGSRLDGTRSHVGGNVEFIGTGSDTGLSAYLCGTTVERNARLDGTAGAAVGGSIASGAACREYGEGNVVGGNLTVVNTSGTFFRVADNTVGKNLNVSSNTAETRLRVWDNTAGFNVNCFDNGPDFNAIGNTGRKLNGQCNIG
jgi:hypothetical protein